jgi:hypothetical protein
MINQSPDSEIIFIAAILLIAISILAILLVAVFWVFFSGAGRRDKFTWRSLVNTIAEFFPKAPSKEEPTPSPPVDMVAQSISEPGQNIELGSSHIAKIERSPKRIQTLNWWVSFIIATYVAWSKYWRVHFIIENTSLNIYFILLSIICPICFAVIWLRLTGFEWRRAIRLFIWVSVAIGGILLLLPYLGFFLKYLSGQCC